MTASPGNRATQTAKSSFAVRVSPRQVRGSFGRMAQETIFQDSGGDANKHWILPRQSSSTTTSYATAFVGTIQLLGMQCPLSDTSIGRGKSRSMITLRTVIVSAFPAQPASLTRRCRARFHCRRISWRIQLSLRSQCGQSSSRSRATSSRGDAAVRVSANADAQTTTHGCERGTSLTWLEG
jgi:hypothetical protein